MGFITRLFGEIVANNIEEKPSVGDTVEVGKAGNLLVGIVKQVLHDRYGNVVVDLEEK